MSFFEDEDHEPDFDADFMALVNNPETLPVHSTRVRLWCLMGAVQLASRHPAAVTSVALQTAISMARHVQAMVATTPALARVAELGWDKTDPAIIPPLEPRPEGEETETIAQLVGDLERLSQHYQNLMRECDLKDAEIARLQATVVLGVPAFTNSEE